MKPQEIYCEVDSCKYFEQHGKCKLDQIQVGPGGPTFYGQNNHDTICESWEEK